ncbi:MAG: hypothetical protein WC788_05420 [Candidatus Paceibacterota bacterium]|jgi:hypothetical protein
MKNALIEIGKDVLAGVITVIVIGLVKKITKKMTHAEEYEIEYRTTVKIRKNIA